MRVKYYILYTGHMYAIKLQLQTLENKMCISVSHTSPVMLKIYILTGKYNSFEAKHLIKINGRKWYNQSQTKYTCKLLIQLYPCRAWNQRKASHWLVAWIFWYSPHVAFPANSLWWSAKIGMQKCLLLNQTGFYNSKCHLFDRQFEYCEIWDFVLGCSVHGTVLSVRNVGLWL